MKPIRLRKELPFVEWPQEIRSRWETAFAKGDNFLDDGGPGAHLQPTSRAALRSACGRFLRYLELEGCELDAATPDKQINPKLLRAYVEYRHASCSDRSIAIELNYLSGLISILRNSATKFPGQPGTMAYGLQTGAG